MWWYCGTAYIYTAAHAYIERIIELQCVWLAASLPVSMMRNYVRMVWIKLQQHTPSATHCGRVLFLSSSFSLDQNKQFTNISRLVLLLVTVSRPQISSKCFNLTRSVMKSNVFYRLKFKVSIESVNACPAGNFHGTKLDGCGNLIELLHTKDRNRWRLNTAGHTTIKNNRFGVIIMIIPKPRSNHEKR